MAEEFLLASIRRKTPSPDHPCYRGPMVVLSDTGTTLAGETFARDLVNTAGAYLMGAATAGSSSAKRSWDLPGGFGRVILSRRSRWGFNRRPIEYNGILPHRKVEVIPTELQQGINSGIKRAEEYLDKKWARKGQAARKLPLVVRKKVDPRIAETILTDTNSGDRIHLNPER